MLAYIELRMTIKSRTVGSQLCILFFPRIAPFVSFHCAKLDFNNGGNLTPYTNPKYKLCLPQTLLHFYAFYVYFPVLIAVTVISCKLTFID